MKILLLLLSITVFTSSMELTDQTIARFLVHTMNITWQDHKGYSSSMRENYEIQTCTLTVKNDTVVYGTSGIHLTENISYDESTDFKLTDSSIVVFDSFPRPVTSELFTESPYNLFSKSDTSGNEVNSTKLFTSKEYGLTLWQTSFSTSSYSTSTGSLVGTYSGENIYTTKKLISLISPEGVALFNLTDTLAGSIQPHIKVTNSEFTYIGSDNINIVTEFDNDYESLCSLSYSKVNFQVCQNHDFNDYLQTNNISVDSFPQFKDSL